MRTAEIVERFSLEGVSRTNAVFDRPKLEWFNTQYLQKLPIDELLPAVQGELERSELWQPEWAAEKREWFSNTVDLLRPRTRLLPDFSTWARAFFSDSFEYDPQAREKFWKDERLGAMLGKLADALAALAGLESRRLRPRAARTRRRRRREGRLADQCDARRDRWAGGGAAAV